MELTGIIQSIGSLENYQGRDGQTFSSRTLVLATEESHPQTAVFTLRNNIAANFNAQVGQRATVHFDFAAFRSKEGDKVFNKLSAWRIDL